MWRVALKHLAVTLFSLSVSVPVQKSEDVGRLVTMVTMAACLLSSCNHIALLCLILYMSETKIWGHCPCEIRLNMKYPMCVIGTLGNFKVVSAHYCTAQIHYCHPKLLVSVIVEWLQCTDPVAMVSFRLGGMFSNQPPAPPYPGHEKEPSNRG